MKIHNIHIHFDFGNCLVIRNDTPLLDCYQIQKDNANAALIDKIEKETSGKFVYFLIDINQAKNVKRNIYIGKTNSLMNRIISHRKNKDWWNTIIVFGNKYLSSDDIDAIEKLLIEEYENSDLYTIKNDVGSNAKLSEHHNDYREYIVDIMDFLSYGVTKTVITPETKTNQVVIQTAAQPLSNSSRQESFKFSMLDIKPGEILSFINNDKVTCEVVDDKNVKYKGKLYSLSSLAKELLNTNVPKRGTDYFLYKGKTLRVLRDEKNGIQVSDVEKTNNWIISCNKEFYDLDNALNEMKIIDFKQNANVEAGSKVYIYSSGEDKKLVYITEAVVVNKPEQTINDDKYIKNKSGYADSNRYMELKLVKKLESDKLSLSDLKKNGLRGNLQGPCRVPVELQAYIDFIIK